jgi:hypothetical protein
VYILERLNKNEEVITEEFSEIMFYFIKLTQSQRVDQKISARNFSELADWKIFINNYINAHNLALEKIRK